MCENVRVIEIKKCRDCDGFGVKVDDDFIKKWQNIVEETAAMLMMGRSCQPLDVLFHELTVGKPTCLACKGIGVWAEKERC